ncbi:histidine--tRNA ligase [Candidatus Dojkabacteria bacterium]|uniref:Histidine--tRNA ligase n=1 Tax=Candidatus Dojkabacteria bacterium TaxID=2099670 RepID=A0A955L9H9_9BACT|nr:histidine--tRNA ligase [Candidatus Dojkabacteria bacterium]
MSKQNIRAPKGFRDFLPEDKKVRNYVMSKISETFEVFGFEPIETPTVEYAETLTGKYGDEADKLIYTFEDRGGRELGLRYDQTVPTARFLIQYQNDLSKYFRRYQIQNVFRAEKPQKGRYREFTQCDIDIFGTKNPIADAEILATTYFAYKNIGFENIILKINDRRILFDSLAGFANDSVDVFSIIQTIDKLDKKTREEVVGELVGKGLEESVAQNALDTILESDSTTELNSIISIAKQLGVPEDAIEFRPELARGLDYYTGMIFEVVCPDYEAGSLGGGGRYDNLIKDISGEAHDSPAVGMAFGFDRTVDAVLDLELLPKNTFASKVLVQIPEADQSVLAYEILSMVRMTNVVAEPYLGDTKNFSKLLKYADKNNFNFVVILGERELEEGNARVKNMETGEENLVLIEDVFKIFATS